MSLLDDLNARIYLNETLELEISAEVEEGKSSPAAISSFRQSFDTAREKGNELTEAAQNEVSRINLALILLEDTYIRLEKTMPALEANVQQILELTGEQFKRLIHLGEVIALGGNHIDMARPTHTQQNMWINDSGKIRTPVDRINSFDKILLSVIEIRDASGNVYEFEQIQNIVKVMCV